MTLLHSLARTMRPLVERNPRLAMAYRHYRDMGHFVRSPVETPFGFRFSGHPAMEAGTFEPNEVRVVKQLLQDADVLINVGYCCCFALANHDLVFAGPGALCPAAIGVGLE